MPTSDRKPRRRRHQTAELAFANEWDAYAACDAAAALPEPERSERHRELRPALRRHVLATWALVPHVDTDAWLERVIELHYINCSIFRMGRPPRRLTLENDK